MENTKVSQCKNAMAQILMYYYEALKEEKSEDPKRDIATEIAEVLKLTDAQKEYIIESSKSNMIKTAIEDLNMIITAFEKNNADTGLIKFAKEDINLLRSLIK